MRIWSLHPRYLDAKGLVALWREGLLAQAVFANRTKGYGRHPQLARLRECGSPNGAIANYLAYVHSEAVRRKYQFDRGRIADENWDGHLDVTIGQLGFEWDHLRGKLRLSDPRWLAHLGEILLPDPLPMFEVVQGGIAEWERNSSDKVLAPDSG